MSGGEGEVQRHDVCNLEELLEAHQRDPQGSCTFVGHETVVRDNLHLKRLSSAGYQSADTTESQQAQRLLREFHATERGPVPPA